MIATSGFLTALECTKFVFDWGSAPDPTGGAYSAPQTSSWFKGSTSKGKETGDGRGKDGVRGEEGIGREQRTAPLRKLIPGSAPG